MKIGLWSCCLALLAACGEGIASDLPIAPPGEGDPVQPQPALVDPAVGTVSPPDAPSGTDGGYPAYLLEPDPLAGFPQGAAQHQLLCARGNADSISKAFCATATPPPITSITDLQKLVGLAFVPGLAANATGGNPGFALISHSSSLVTRFTSPINPRALIFTAALGGTRPSTPKPNPAYVAMGFVRGEQFVELASKDAVSGQLRFFLFKFEQACNSAPGGCTHGDLLTPAIESNFTGYSLYEDIDIKNTVFDCAQCHQAQGPSSQKILRMQELQFPWNHFIFNEPPANVYLKNDYLAAHSGEAYAGIPANAVTLAAPPKLEAFVENNGFMAQPNEFLTGTISSEVVASAPTQPQYNVPVGTSATWQKLYDNYLTGAAIPPPYHDNRITDANKLLAMTNAYKSAMSGATPVSQLPDIRDVFLDAALPDMTMAPKPGSTGAQILVQMCQQCHNSRLDQTISRARFNVQTLAQMSRAEKDLAILRIHLPKSSARHMPPERFRDLSAADIDLVTQELLK